MRPRRATIQPEHPIPGKSPHTAEKVCRPKPGAEPLPAAGVIELTCELYRWRGVRHENAVPAANKRHATARTPVRARASLPKLDKTGGKRATGPLARPRGPTGRCTAPRPCEASVTARVTFHSRAPQAHSPVGTPGNPRRGRAAAAAIDPTRPPDVSFEASEGLRRVAN